MSRMKAKPQGTPYEVERRPDAVVFTSLEPTLSRRLVVACLGLPLAVGYFVLCLIGMNHFSQLLSSPSPWPYSVLFLLGPLCLAGLLVGPYLGLVLARRRFFIDVKNRRYWYQHLFLSGSGQLDDVCCVEVIRSHRGWYQVQLRRHGKLIRTAVWWTETAGEDQARKAAKWFSEELQVPIEFVKPASFSLAL